MFETLGFTSVEAFLAETVEPFFLSRDANNLVAMLQTWLHADISANGRFGGSLKAALGAIQCKALVMPGTTDLYFTPEDSEGEVALMPNAELLPIPSVWGHRAGNPRQNPEDAAFLDLALYRLLAS